MLYEDTGFVFIRMEIKNVKYTVVQALRLCTGTEALYSPCGP